EARTELDAAVEILRALELTHWLGRVEGAGGAPRWRGQTPAGPTGGPTPATSGRGGSRAPPSVLRKARAAGGPGPPRMRPGLPRRRRVHGGTHRRDRGISRTGGRRVPRRVPAVVQLALLWAGRHRVR